MSKVFVHVLYSVVVKADWPQTSWYSSSKWHAVKHTFAVVVLHPDDMPRLTIGPYEVGERLHHLMSEETEAIKLDAVVH